MIDADLDKTFWTEAVSTARYLRNRSTASGLDNKTPYELWNGVKLKIFGSTVMLHIPKEKRQKLDKKARQQIFVGYSDIIKGYRIYNQ